MPQCFLLAVTVSDDGIEDHHAPGRVRRDTGQPYLTGHETDWAALGQSELHASLTAKLPTLTPATNLILFVGDGMGPSTVTAARWHLQQADDLKAFQSKLAWDTWPVTGLSKVNSERKRHIQSNRHHKT